MDSSIIIKVGDILVLDDSVNIKLRRDPWYYLVVDLDVKNMTVGLFKITNAYYDGLKSPIRKNVDLKEIIRHFNDKLSSQNVTYWRPL